MSELTNFLQDLLHDKMNDIKISMVGKIEAFDKEKMRADVTPLLKKKVGDVEVEYTLLKQVPVTFLLAGDYYIRPEYKQGDLVQILFSTNDIAQALNANKAVESKKIFTPENAFIIGGIAKTGWTHPSEFSDKEGLIIGHKDGQAYTQYCDKNILFMLEGVEMKVTKETIEMAGNTIKLTSSGVDINNGALTVGQ